MPPDSQLIEDLVKDLKPVRPRSAKTDALIAGGLGVVELALFLGLGMARPDMPAAMAHPSFWWKLCSLGVIAVLGAIAAIVSFDPAASPRRGLRWVAIAIGVCFVVGWVVDAERGGMPNLLSRLDWRNGIQCALKMAALSLPPLIGLGLLMHRGAPTDTSGTALAVGITAAAWGAFVFVFACPYDDPLYLAVWYTVGCGVVTMFARLLLPRLLHW